MDAHAAATAVDVSAVRESVSTPRQRLSLQASRSSGSLSEADESAHNQVVARSAQGAVFYLFNHQAGGHKPFLRTADGKVCKPAIPLELQFYQAVDEQYPQLKPFVPPFVGVVTVELNFPTPTSAAASSDSDASSIASSPSVGDLSQLVADRKSPVKGAFAKVSLLPSAHGKKRRLSKHGGGLLSSSTSASPAGYSAKLWRKERTKRKAAIARSNSTGPLKDILLCYVLDHVMLSVCAHYLVLDDLTQHYTRPCVLDIKMGTRQHGADATPAKALSHTAKCEATTSATLGLRICGMQVYNQDDERYTLWDKHWGRKLTVDDMERALETYLSNGSSVRHDVLAPLLTKVQALKCEIERTRGVRFWGASLLIIYEGDTRRSAPREDVYLIDFAHCQMSPELDSPDDGLVLGLTNLAQYLSSILAKRSGCAGSGSGATDSVY